MSRTSDENNNAPTSGALPRWLLAAYGVSAVFATISGIVAYPWLAGAAISGTLAAAVAHRRVWRWPPDPLGWTFVALATLAGAAVAVVLSQTTDRPHSVAGGPSTRSSTAKTPPTATTAAAHGNGQIVGGNRSYTVSNTTEGTPFRNSASFADRHASEGAFAPINVDNPRRETTTNRPADHVFSTRALRLRARLDC